MLQGARLVDPVHGGRAATGIRRDEETGIGHAQRFEDPFVEHDVERLALDPRQRDAENLGAMAVGESFTRLVDQRQCGHLGQPVVLILTQRHLPVGPADRSAHRERVGQPAAVGHQVVDGDRSLGRHGVVQWAVRIHQDPHIGHLGKPLADRVGQRQFAFLSQRHRRRHRDRFGHRGNPKKGVASHREAGLDIGRADLIDLQHIPAMPHTCDGTGNQAGVGRRSYRVPIVR